jgi:hypothetical protein
MLVWWWRHEAKRLKYRFPVINCAECSSNETCTEPNLDDHLSSLFFFNELERSRNSPRCAWRESPRAFVFPGEPVLDHIRHEEWPWREILVHPSLVSAVYAAQNARHDHVL